MALTDRKMAAVLRRASLDGLGIDVMARMVCMANHPKQRKPCPPGAHVEYVRRLLAEPRP